MNITNYKDFENVINYGFMALGYEHAENVNISFQKTRSIFTIRYKNDYFISYFKNQIYSIVPFNQLYILHQQIKFLISKYQSWESVNIIYKKNTRKELRKYEQL